jgi:hypothetical protein
MPNVVQFPRVRYEERPPADLQEIREKAGEVEPAELRRTAKRAQVEASAAARCGRVEEEARLLYFAAFCLSRLARERVFTGSLAAVSSASIF